MGGLVVLAREVDRTDVVGILILYAQRYVLDLLTAQKVEQEVGGPLQDQHLAHGDGPYDPGPLAAQDVNVPNDLRSDEGSQRPQDFLRMDVPLRLSRPTRPLCNIFNLKHRVNPHPSFMKEVEVLALLADIVKHSAFRELLLDQLLLQLENAVWIQHGEPPDLAARDGCGVRLAHLIAYAVVSAFDIVQVDAQDVGPLQGSG